MGACEYVADSVKTVQCGNLVYDSKRRKENVSVRGGTGLNNNNQELSRNRKKMERRVVAEVRVREKKITRIPRTRRNALP